jgi:basic amino acid/polyamine antiporter, APA family
MMAGQEISSEGTPAGSSAALPLFTRRATGLVREVSLLDMSLYNMTCTSPIGSGLVFALFTLLLFPRANFYIAWPIAVVVSVFVWTTFALMSAAIPRIGGDYTYNSRVLHPLPAFAVNVCTIFSSILAGGLWATWVATLALSGVLSVIGDVANSSRVSRWGSYFTPVHHNVVFVTALLSLAFVCLMGIRGTKALVRVMTIMILVATAGFIIDLGILAFTSHSSFVNDLNSTVGAGTYQKTVAAGAKQGLYGGYTTKDTIGGIVYLLGFTVYIYLGVFLAPEFKGAGQRKRQMTSMVAAGLIQGGLIYIGAIIFLRTVGLHFFQSALNGNFGPGLSDYSYFASLVAGNSLFVTIVALAFLGWWIPGMAINIIANQRAYMTWSFDGLLPRRVSEVNDRTHTPVTAIIISFVAGSCVAAWAAYSSNFFKVFAYSLLLGYIPIIVVGLSAIVMRYRRADLYERSPAQWRLMGVEVLPIAGIGAIIVGVFDMLGLLYFHDQVGFPLGWAIFAPIACLAVGALWWLVARAVRRQEGIDIGAAARSLPPD